MRRVLFLLPILAVLIFAGCGGKQSVATSTKLITPNSFPVKIKLSTKKLQGRLFSQYSSWKGVPYRYGGLSKSGVDCSGFVFNAFKDGLGIVLPRSTKELVKIGKKVKKKKLRSGDLVFFKTGKKTRHVGIYYKDGKFMHASTSKGVEIARLDNPYWKKHYWKSARILKN